MSACYSRHQRMRVGWYTALNTPMIGYPPESGTSELATGGALVGCPCGRSTACLVGAGPPAVPRRATDGAALRSRLQPPPHPPRASFRSCSAASRRSALPVTEHIMLNAQSAPIVTDGKNWCPAARQAEVCESLTASAMPIPTRPGRPPRRHPWTATAAILGHDQAIEVRAALPTSPHPAHKCVQMRPRVRVGSVPQRSSTGIGGHQRSSTVQKNRKSPTLQVMQLG